jgi:hypothetical protein
MQWLVRPTAEDYAVLLFQRRPDATPTLLVQGERDSVAEHFFLGRQQEKAVTLTPRQQLVLSTVLAPRVGLPYSGESRIELPPHHRTPPDRWKSS